MGLLRQSSLASCLLLIGGSALAQDVSKVIERAIRAHGGAAALERLSAAETHTKGVMSTSGREVPFTQDVFFAMPGRFRDVLYLEVDRQKRAFTTVYDGQSGWIDNGDKTSKMDERMLTEAAETAHAVQVARLIGLVSGRYRLAPLDDAEVASRPAAGVRVSAAGHRDVDLFFDKDSGLLVKVRRPVIDLRSGEAVTEERLLSDYRQVQGIQSARRVRLDRGGRRFMDVEIAEVKFLERLDDSTFAKP